MSELRAMLLQLWKNNMHSAKMTAVILCQMCNWFCAPGHSRALTQTEVKHVLVKLHKRLSCLLGKLSPSVALLLTAPILYCLVHTASSFSFSVSFCLSSSFLLSSPNTLSPPSLYSMYPHSWAEPSWASLAHLLTVIVTALIKTPFGGWELNFILGRTGTTCVSF